MTETLLQLIQLVYLFPTSLFVLKLYAMILYHRGKAKEQIQIVRSSALDVSLEEDLKTMAEGIPKEAITFWSHDKIAATNDDKGSSTTARSLFSKITQFLNDIKDPARGTHRQ